MTVSESASVRKSWADGFVADFALSNSSGTAGPVSAIVEIDGSIRKHWGDVELEDLGDGRYRVTAPDLDPGESVEGGFVADGDADAGVLIGPGDAEDTTSAAPDTAPAPDESVARVEPTPTPEQRTAPEVETETAPSLPEADVTVSPDISASELQTLIDDSAPGTTILLSEGTYEFDRTIEISRSDITLRGAGSDDVTIRVDSGLGEEAFRIADGARHGDTTLAEEADEGAREITLSGNHDFEAGDFVYLARETTHDWLDEIGDREWRETVPLRTSIVEVEAVDGNTLTLASGLHFDFDTDETLVQEIDLLTGVELGGFTVDYGLGAANPSDFSNTQWNYGRNAVIEVEGTSGLVLSDIAAHDVPSLGTNVALSRAVDAHGLTMTGAHNKGVGGNGYALQIRDVYDSRFTGLNDLDMRHSVVFASWRSAAGNEVHVESTDRDINFHGGRDHHNRVWVDRSVRDAESDVIAPSVFMNTEGTHYGAPTDPETNLVTVRYAVGSSRRDDITGDDAGAWLDGAGSHDILRGGAGTDVLIGGHGRDTLIGGDGEDVALYTGDLEDFRIDAHGDTLEVRDMEGDQHRDEVSGVEWLVFDDAAYRVSDGAAMDRGTVTDMLASPEGGSSGLPERSDTPEAEDEAAVAEPAPTDSVQHDDGAAAPEAPAMQDDTGFADAWVAVTSATDAIMQAHHDKLSLTGDGDISASGTGGNDLILGNSGANLIKGGDGDDRAWARGGDDRVFGGSGNDALNGGGGDDLLHGGGGIDILAGGAGADTFRFDRATQSDAQGADRITDFSEGDLIDLSRIDADESAAGDQAFHWSGTSPDGAGSVWVAGGALQGDVDGDGAADLLVNVNDHAFGPDDFVF